MKWLRAWVYEAAEWPLTFAQVREDALIDLWLVEQLCFRQLEVIMIASGGCTAAALAASNRVSHLHLVDINSAQIELARLKLYLLQTATPQERAELLGHLPLKEGSRFERLLRISKKIGLTHAIILGVEPELSGLDYSGRYEQVFKYLRIELRQSHNEIVHLLSLRDPGEQARLVAPDMPLGKKLDEAFDAVMALPNLVHLFGEAATRNALEPFSRHFARRTRHVLSTLSAADNPYLWQVLLGHYPKEVSTPWLCAPAPQQMPKVTWSVESMDAALAKTRNDFDIVHLSNILDWLTPQEATRMLENAWRALRPGGYTIIRQLNSTLNIPSLHPEFEWQIDQANSLHARDRSFFYRALHLGRKP